MQDASEDACRFRPERPPLLLELDQRGGRADSSRSVEQLAVVAEQRPEFSLADANGVLQHGLKHRLKLAWRPADHLENLRRRGLLLQGLGKIIGALAQLVEQARVLDGDDGLIGEAREQLDLLVGEWADLLAVHNGPDQLIFLEHWHRQARPSAGSLHCRHAQWIAIEISLFGFQVGNVDHPLGTRETAEACCWASGDWAAFQEVGQYGRSRMHCGSTKVLAVIDEQVTKFCLTEAARVGQNSLEDRLKVGWRTTDRAEYL
jgi:hypothetical protein